MAENQEAFTSGETSMTLVPPGAGDSDSGITIVDVDELTRSVNTNETGTAASASRQTQEQQEPMAQQTSPPTDEPQSITIIIGEVDKLTRDVDKAEYNPNHVSIGPYHWINSPNNLKREEEKRACLRAIVQSAGRSFTEAAELELLHELESLVDKARSCYAHQFHQMDRRQFVRMLLLDGSYLLHLFGLVACGRQGRNDAQCNGGASNNNVVRDVLFLAENQIPFFVLVKIHQLIVRDSSASASDSASASASASAAAVAGGMNKYVRQLLSPVYSVAKPQVMNNLPGNLLHLLHMHLVEPTVIELPETRDAGDNQAAVGMDGRRWRTATQYRHIAGVKLKQRPIREAGAAHAKCILDVQLRGGTLEVPCLSVDGQTCAMLRNLMALEQANPGPGVINRHVTAYCVFISQLACTAADVELLSKKLIINHTLGSDEEMARCFADLCKGILFDINDGGCNYLRATCQELEARFQSSPRRWMAGLHQKHLSNPWAIFGLVSAVLLLLCTLLQAVFAVLGYHSQNQK